MEHRPRQTYARSARSRMELSVRWDEPTVRDSNGRQVSPINYGGPWWTSSEMLLEY